MSSRTTTCPNIVNCVHVSRTTRPVTQVALVAVNIASTTLSKPLRLAAGSVSSSVPSAISSTKLTQMIWVALLPTSRLLRCVFFFQFSHEELLLPPRQPWRFRGGIVLARCAAGVLFIGYTFFLFPST